jgi:hypothetical protein
VSAVIDIYKYAILERCRDGNFIRRDTDVAETHIKYLEKRNLIRPERSFDRGGRWRLTRSGEAALAALARIEAQRKATKRT